MVLPPNVGYPKIAILMGQPCCISLSGFGVPILLRHPTSTAKKTNSPSFFCREMQNALGILPCKTSLCETLRIETVLRCPMSFSGINSKRKGQTNQSSGNPSWFRWIREVQRCWMSTSEDGISSGSIMHPLFDQLPCRAPMLPSAECRHWPRTAGHPAANY